MDLARVADQNLKDFKEVADELGIRFMLMDGTLLGAYRDGGYVKDDEDDIDLGIMADQFEKVPELIEKLIAKGFENPKKVVVDGELHGGALSRNGNHVDIMKMIPDGDVVYNIGELGALRYNYPASEFDGYSKIEFRGMEFDAPKDIEGNLTTRYGDWRTPVGRNVYDYKNPIFSPNVEVVGDSKKNICNMEFDIRPNSWDERILYKEVFENCYKIKRPKVVVDIGSHIGGTAILSALSGAIVYAYEPSEINYRQLVKNVKINGFEDSIKTFKLAVGDKTRLYHHPTNFGCFSLNSDNTEGMADSYEEVETISIKDVFKDIEHCDLLKIDCEGSETDFYKDIPYEKIDQISIETHRENSAIKDHLSKFYKIEELGGHFDRILICKKY